MTQNAYKPRTDHSVCYSFMLMTHQIQANSYWKTPCQNKSSQILFWQDQMKSCSLPLKCTVILQQSVLSKYELRQNNTSTAKKLLHFLPLNSRILWIPHPWSQYMCCIQNKKASKVKHTLKRCVRVWCSTKSPQVSYIHTCKMFLR